MRVISENRCRWDFCHRILFVFRWFPAARRPGRFGRCCVSTGLVGRQGELLAEWAAGSSDRALSKSVAFDVLICFGF